MPAGFAAGGKLQVAISPPYALDRRISAAFLESGSDVLGAHPVV
jgi:hypothetical protein